ncbi:hypothetical protein [uncultured Draconibacterium sp.]|nr:hypothetical protein [uncultured Draconibacterium sp.]
MTKQLALNNNGLPAGFIPLLYVHELPGVLAKAPLQSYESTK